MPEFDIQLKEVEPLRAATAREIVANYASVGGLMERLFNELDRQDIQPVGPPMALYYDEGYKESDVDVEVAFPLAETAEYSGETFEVKQLPGGTFAALIRKGPYDDFTPAYGALMGWIQELGYRIIGPNREIYLRGPESYVEPAEYLTEIQFPVTKA